MKITVFGAGKSGIAVARKLRGKEVFLTEEKKTIDAEALRALKKLGVHYELGGHTEAAIRDADLIVVSPGVHLDIPMLKKARARNIPIISEIELAYSCLKKPIIAVTGTNGKTTTTSLIGRMLNDAGLKSAVAGNIGYPLISVNDSELDYIVAEISSYQLEAIRDFKPWISVILNITPDHLTRHHTMKEYAGFKANIFKNQKGRDHLIYNYDDELTASISREARCERIPFSRKKILRSGACVKGGKILFKGRTICGTAEIRIKGEHNIENALAAASAAMLCGAPAGSIRRTLMTFKGVEHRIEYVRALKGVSYYNDSKGTNPDSTIVAIKALSKSRGIVLILGGRDKMTDLRDMCNVIKKNVKDVVLIGEAKGRFKKALTKAGFRRVHESGTFMEAVKNCKKLAKAGDAVLLSPACASFDMFKNFEERGKVFKKIVAKL